MNKILVEVSVGELLDKISILEIKKEKIKDSEKLRFINDEYDVLKDQFRKNVKSDEINKRQKKVIKENIAKDQNKKIKSNYEPQSYRVVIILKGVDPTDPSQKFSNVLKNANIIFEIEKIERFQENDLKN